MSLTAITERIQHHLQDVLVDPGRRLDERLLEQIDRQITETISESQRDSLLNKLSELIPTLQQDPTPITELIIRLIAPEGFDFTRARSIEPPVNFVAGLTTKNASVNLVTLSLLEKAHDRTGDIGIVAGEIGTVKALIKIWLCTPETSVAQKALKVLVGLLQGNDINDVEDQIIYEVSIETQRGNLMWRRIFHDPDVYGLIFSICSLKTKPDGHIKPLAQGRLFDLLLRIDSETVRTSQLREIEQNYGVQDGGLLDFAINHMVDYQRDDLMLTVLVSFCTRYLVVRPNNVIDLSESSHSLPLLVRAGVHDRIMSMWLHPSADTPSWLQSEAAEYISRYCSLFPNDLLRSASRPQTLRERLNKQLSLTSSSSWAEGSIPMSLLKVLTSLPRVMLLSSGPNDTSPLFLLPSRPANADVLNTLSVVFSKANGHDDSAAARALYFLYLEENPDLWSHVITAADRVALTDVALAAINFIGSIITASWATLATSPPPSQRPYATINLTETSLSNTCNHGQPLPQTGIEALLSAKTVTIVLPYLMNPAQTFSNLVGGGRGDVQSAAWRVAVAKHDVLTKFHEELGKFGGSPEVQSIVNTVGRKVAQGPRGGTSQIGGRVATMER